MPDALGPVAAAAIYALFSLDHFAVGPFLLSRPIVIGPIVGALAGQPDAGLAIGLLAEALWIAVPPAGPAQWDVGLFAALAALWAADMQPNVDKRPFLAAAALVAFPLAMLGRRVDAWARRQVRPWTDRAMGGLRRGEGGPLSLSLALSSALWVFKSVLIFLVFSSLGGALYMALIQSVFSIGGLTTAWNLWACLAVAAVVNHFLARLAPPELLAKKEAP